MTVVSLGTIRRQETRGVIVTFENQFAAENLIALRVRGVAKFWKQLEVWLAIANRAMAGGTIFKKEQIPKPRALSTKGSFTISRPEVERVAQRFFRPIVEVVAE